MEADVHCFYLSVYIKYSGKDGLKFSIVFSYFKFYLSFIYDYSREYNFVLQELDDLNIFVNPSAIE